MRTGIVLAALLTIWACKSDPAPCVDATTGRAVDAQLLAFLSRARAAHHTADRAEETNDRAQAIRVLADVVRGPFPAGGERGAPEVREVLADTLARLAELRSEAGAFDAAEADITRGLELVPEPSYFRGHLYEVSGLMWEQRARALRERGDPAGADAARARALEALETAMKIQADVIRRSVPANSERK
jgi:hypothetical protein